MLNDITIAKAMISFKVFVWDVISVLLEFLRRSVQVKKHLGAKWCDVEDY